MSDDKIVNIKVIRFYTQWLESKTEPGVYNRPVDYVEWAPRHNAIFSQLSDRVEDWRPPKYMKNDDDGMRANFFKARWDVVGPAYEAWKNGQEIPETGTPFAAWSGLVPEHAEVLKSHGYKTVEELAALTDSQMGRIQLPHMHKLRELSRQYLEGRERTGEIKRINELEEKLAVAMEMLEQATAPKKRKPKEETVEEDEAA